MGGGYHGGFGHTFGAQAQEMNLVVTRPICVEEDEVIINAPTVGPTKGSIHPNDSSTPTMITLSVIGDSRVPVKFWYGYLEDLLSEPTGNSCEWRGFTRDFYKKKGAFSKRTHTAVIEPEEYLWDISVYESRSFRYANTFVVIQKIQELLAFACSIRKAVRVTVL